MKRYIFNTYDEKGHGSTFIYEWHRGMMSAKNYARLLLSDELLRLRMVDYEII